MRSAQACITSIGTAVPEYQYSQEELAHFMLEMHPGETAVRRQIQALYSNSSISFRHSVLSDFRNTSDQGAFYRKNGDALHTPALSSRMRAYQKHAVPLALQACKNCLESAEVTPDQITHLIYVSCTGMYAPGPDIELAQKLQLPERIHRIAINFMGCYGAFSGMKTAEAIVKANPTAKALVICTELCTLHFQNKTDSDNLLANALFADGAAAALVESTPRTNSFRMLDFSSQVFPEGANEMSWHIGDLAFEMKLTSRVPNVLKKGIPGLFDSICAKLGITREAIRHYAFHPGGRRILEALEEALDLPQAANESAYQVLQQYGNMSSPTVLFVLNTLLSNKATKDADLVFSGAFGPGLTAETAVFQMIK